jgi:two-component system chemotaxis sensor kinase CheA
MSEYDELLPAFIEESQSHLQIIEPDILALEQSSDTIDPAVVNRIFRGIHSIKGASGFFGLQNIANLSHVIENVLVLLRDGKITPTSDLTDALLKGVDTLKSMIDNVRESEQFDIQEEAEQLQKFLDKISNAQKTVTVAEKKTDEEKPDEELGRFHMNAYDFERLVSEGLNLYAIKIFLDKDLRQRDISPYDLIKNMEALGEYVDSFLDIRSISGLSDCLNSDLAFDFLFATKLDPDLVPEGLDLPPDRVSVIDLDEFREKLETEKTADLESQISKIKGQETGRRAQEASSKAQGAGDRGQHPTPNNQHPTTNNQQTTNNNQQPTTNKQTYSVQAEERIRVGVSFLNDLVNLAGELVLGRNQLMQVTLPLVKHTPGLNPVLQHISRVTSEMQEKIMQMRMQPISLIFSKFNRLVRTLAKSHNKEVRLITYGEDVELDKSIIEGLSDPLTHLIRNSVDHGIEVPEDREKTGKPRLGTIELRAYHQGGQVHLVITDDGRGVDGKFVARKALEKGLIRQDQLNTMIEKDWVRLIFRPGFSTADQVTDLSGRGVGMDVVITNIEHLGGTVDIETKIGKGTKITLVLPLTLAIVSGLLIQSADHFFILPEVDIDELVRVKPDEIESRINTVQDAYVLRLRDMLLPLVDLNEVLGLSESVLRSQLSFANEQPASDNPQLATNNPQQTKTKNQKPLRILVIKHGSSRFGLIVDSIESTEEIVVKPLPRYLKKMKCFSGVSILGNGKVSLILDVAGILKKANVRHLEESKDEIKEKDSAEEEIQTFLLFDNNTRERFAIPLELISRIERVSASEIEYIKDRQFIQYHDKKLRLIFLENYLPVTPPQRSSEDTIGIIIPKQTKHPLGIVIHTVINTVSTAIELDTETIMGPGLFGSAVLDGRITLIPDIYRLFELAAPEWYAAKSYKREQGRKYRVLLAEDTPFFRMVETEYLTSAGYEVIQAEDGKKAMHILEETRVDAAILDIVMPRMDGWETIKAIRADDRLKKLPVMAVTSLDSEGLAQKGLEAGFTQWELKLNKTRLLEKLAMMLTS